MRVLPFIIAIGTITLSACASDPHFGNFLDHSSSFKADKMAIDAVNRLVLIYPPANTQLDLQHDMSDPFGSAFVQKLRTSGYAVREYNHVSKDNGLPLSYIIDQPKDTTYYRVTVFIDKQRLDRVYQVQNEKTIAAGYWVLGE